MKFSTFASKVVLNGLRTYFQQKNRKQKLLSFVPMDEILESNQPLVHPIEQLICEEEITEMLDQIKKQYTGKVRIGIEAIELKIKGYTGTDIAQMYGTSPKLVGTWISKARVKLRQNPDFISWMKDR